MSLVVNPSYALIKPFTTDITSHTQFHTPQPASNSFSQVRDNGIIFKWSSFGTDCARSQAMNMNESNTVTHCYKSNKPSPIIISGWLHKMKRQSTVFSADWNKRYVVIQNNALSWKHAKESEIAGSIDLDNVQNVKMIYNERIQKKGEQPRSFVVKTSNRTLCLMANNQSDCEKWVRLIQMQLDLNSGGTSSGPGGKKNRRKNNGAQGDKFEVMMKTLDKSFGDLSDISFNSESLPHFKTSEEDGLSSLSDLKKRSVIEEVSSKHGNKSSGHVKTIEKSPGNLFIESYISSKAVQQHAAPTQNKMETMDLITEWDDVDNDVETLVLC